MCDKEDKDEARIQEALVDVMPALRAYARLQCRNAWWWEDVMQEATLLAIKRHRENEDIPVVPYIYGIVRRLALSRWRKENRRHEIEAEIELEGAELMNNMVYTTQKPDPEMLVDFNRSFLRLDKYSQSVLERKYGKGLSHDEIAEQDGISAEACRQRVVRIKRTLSRLLEADRNENKK